MVFSDCYGEVSSPNREHNSSAPMRAVHARQGWEQIEQQPLSTLSTVLGFAGCVQVKL